MACGSWDLVCKGKESVIATIGDALTKMAEQMVKGMDTVIQASARFWVGADTPDLTGDGYTPSAEVSYIQGSLKWYMLGLAVLGVIIGGARMAWEQRGEPGRELLKSLFTFALVYGGLGLGAISIGVEAADEFAECTPSARAWTCSPVTSAAPY